jgi:MFS family permease
MAIGYLLIGGGLSAVAWADSLESYAFSIVLFTFGEMICMPITMAYAANLAPSNMRGRFMGLFGLTWASALLVGPALGMLLFEWNPSVLWIGCGILSVTAATIILKRI